MAVPSPPAGDGRAVLLATALQLDRPGLGTRHVRAGPTSGPCRRSSRRGRRGAEDTDTDGAPTCPLWTLLEPVGQLVCLLIKEIYRAVPVTGAEAAVTNDSNKKSG